VKGEPLSWGTGKSLESPLSGSSSKMPDIQFKQQYMRNYKRFLYIGRSVQAIGTMNTSDRVGDRFVWARERSQSVSKLEPCGSRPP